MKICNILAIIQKYFRDQLKNVDMETYQQVISPIVERDMDSDNNNGC